MKAIIEVDVPDYQIGQEVSIYFKDTMTIKSIVQKSKTGEWQQDLDGAYLCSECGSGFKEQPTLMGKPMFLWCPLCGTRTFAPQESDDKE